ncbi:hypothetical protein ACQQCD_02575 [Pseudarthrobacter sp. J1763]|uniref:hypothetical protein n=1 Tax=Pseudarthrobacter sp. J1763 TaxID=3420445 RepID=UPI003D2BD8AD
MDKRVTVKQGTQPEFDGVRVGIVRVGTPEGTPAVQMWIAAEGKRTKQAFREGGSTVLPNGGMLTIAAIRPAGEGSGEVDLVFVSGDAPA